MVELHFDTEFEAIPSDVDCSWSSIIQGIERYAAFQPANASELYQWADLLEGVRQMRDEL